MELTNSTIVHGGKKKRHLAKNNNLCCTRNLIHSIANFMNIDVFLIIFVICWLIVNICIVVFCTI